MPSFADQPPSFASSCTLARKSVMGRGRMMLLPAKEFMPGPKLPDPAVRPCAPTSSSVAKEAINVYDFEAVAARRSARAFRLEKKEHGRRIDDIPRCGHREGF